MKTYAGCWAAGVGPDRGSMAPEEAPPGLRDREGAPWAPPLKEVNSWLLLRCMGRTGLSIMLSCREGMRLQHVPHTWLSITTSAYCKCWHVQVPVTATGIGRKHDRVCSSCMKQSCLSMQVETDRVLLSACPLFWLPRAANNTMV